MKILLLSACLAGGMAVAGCSTDQPIFQSETSAQKAVNGTTADSDAPQASAQETNRDIMNEQHSGASMQGVGGPSNPTSKMQMNNPYGH